MLFIDIEAALCKGQCQVVALMMLYALTLGYLVVIHWPLLFRGTIKNHACSQRRRLVDTVLLLLESIFFLN